MRKWIALLALLTGVGYGRAATEETVRLANLDVVVWSSPAGKTSKQPVIIFSHGFHGSATQSRFLMEAFADAGYLVFAPNHKDAVVCGGEVTWKDKSMAPFKSPETWTEATYHDRAEDIVHLLSAIGSDNRFRSRADLSQVGLAGHSLGGYTVLGLAGAWPSWKVPGIKAVLALSPYSQPFVVRQTLGGLDAPVMYQGGTRDFGITPLLTKSQGAYDLSAKPKYLVDFEGATHFAWADIGRTAHDDIAVYSVAFMDHYVKGAPASFLLSATRPGVSELRYSSDLGNGTITPAASQPAGILPRLLQRLGSSR